MKTSSLVVAIATCAWTASSLAQAPTGNAGQQTEAAASTTAGQPGKTDKTIAETIRGYTVERREEAVATARRATDEIDRQMERLQTQMSEGWSLMSSASRERSEKAMADLRTRRNSLAEWVGGMKHGSSGAWTEVKGGFARSYDELADALRKARSEFELGRQEKTPPSKPAEEHPKESKSS